MAVAHAGPRDSCTDRGISRTVDAVPTMAPDPDHRWRPGHVLVTRSEETLQCRGMRRGNAPLRALFKSARAAATSRFQRAKRRLRPQRDAFVESR
jgi:hypothetical protein